MRSGESAAPLLSWEGSGHFLSLSGRITLADHGLQIQIDHAGRRYDTKNETGTYNVPVSFCIRFFVLS